jgi:hypothetical protein
MNVFALNPKNITNRLSINNLNRNIHLSLAIYYFVIHTLTIVGVNPKISVGILVILTISKFFLNFQIKSHRDFLGEFLRTPWLYIAIIFALWIQFPAILLSNKFGVKFGMVTTGNNDVASYAMVGQEFLRSGFYNSSHYFNYNMNFQAETFSYQAPNMLVSIFSTILSLNAWQVMTLVMLFALILSILSLASILENMNIQITKSKSILIGAIVCSTPLVCYVIGNYFLGQILALSVSASLLSLGMKIISARKFGVSDGVYLAGLTVLASMTYPHFLLPFLFILFTVVFILLFYVEKKIPITDAWTLFGSLLSGLVLSSLVIWKTHGLLIQTFSMTGNGWSLPTLTPQAIVLNRFFIGIEQPSLLNTLSWLIFALLILTLMFLVRRSDGQWLFSVVLLVGFGLGTLLLILTRDIPATNYTNWKLISYMAPLFLIIVFGYLMELRKFSGFTLVLLCLVLSATPAIDWMSTFRDNRGSVTKDMQDLGSSKLLRQYSKINIDVKPWFETMALASIVPNSNVNMVNSNYYFLAQDPSACSIVRRDNRNYGTFIKLNDTYGLSQSKDKSCGRFALPEIFELEIPSNIDFSSKGNGAPALVTGWSTPEPWGVWSDGNESILRFKVKQVISSDLLLTLYGSPFDLPTGDQKVEVLVNGELLLKMGKQEKSSKGYYRIILPRELIAKYDNRVELLIKISNPKSPMELGISNDPRKLGFGLVSISIKQSR